jgi:hypothetical protein
MNHPIQPIYTDPSGKARFKQNKIIDFLIEMGSKKGFGLNEIACMDFPIEDRVQLAQLIGYSVEGFAELSYVTDEDYGAVLAMANEGMTEDKARIADLRARLLALKEGILHPIAQLYGIHPDDLRNDPTANAE